MVGTDHPQEPRVGTKRVWVSIQSLLFPDTPQTLLTIAEFVVGAAGIAGTLLTMLDLAGFVTQESMRVFAWYLWASLIVQVFTLTSLLVVVRATLRVRSLARAGQRTITTRERAIQLLHLTAEEVRRCSVNGQIDCQERLQSLLGSSLTPYLQARLDATANFSVTVKYIANGCLKDIFRNAQQRGRPFSLNDPLDDNYVFRTFKNGTQGTRYVLVRDTANVPPQYEQFRQRAQQRNYRSMIAFPLNLPMEAPGGQYFTSLVGFLGIDSPEPNAFDGLFESRVPMAQIRDNYGQDQKPLNDIELFYGLADSLATILGLNQASAIPIESEEKEQP